MFRPCLYGSSSGQQFCITELKLHYQTLSSQLYRGLEGMVRRKQARQSIFSIDSIWYHGYFNAIDVFIREVQNSGDLFMNTDITKKGTPNPHHIKKKRRVRERDCKKELELLQTWLWRLTSFTCRHHTYPLMTQGKYGKGSKPLSWQMAGSWNHSEKNVLRRLKDKNMF